MSENACINPEVLDTPRITSRVNLISIEFFLVSRTQNPVERLVQLDLGSSFFFFLLTTHFVYKVILTTGV